MYPKAFRAPRISLSDTILFSILMRISSSTLKGVSDICFVFFLLGLNQLRQFLACSIVCFAYRYIALDKRFTKYAILILLASTFHFSALIMLPAYFVLKLRMKMSYLAIASLFLLPFNFFYNQMLQFLFTVFKPSYVGTSFMDKTFVLDNRRILGALIITALVLFYFDQIETSGALNKVFANGALLATLLLALCGWIPEVHRFAYYLQAPIIFLLANIIKLERSVYIRVFILAAVSVYYFFFFTNNAAALWGVLPYKTIFG